MKQKWTNVKVYYSVLTVCLLMIVGISAAIYNFSLNKAEEVTSPSSSSIAATSPDEQANVPATGVPKTSETTPITTTTPPEKLPFEGNFQTPTKGKLIKDYSNGEMVKSETMGDWRVHNGIDFSAEDGESVLAVQDGVVTEINKDALWGVSIEIACPGGLKVKYFGVQENVNVKKGDKVVKGAVIGVAGTLPIESAQGTHIHIETTVDDILKNPIEALNLM